MWHFLSNFRPAQTCSAQWMLCWVIAKVVEMFIDGVCYSSSARRHIWRKKFIDYTSVKQIWTNYLLLLDWSIFGCTNLPWVLLEEKKRPIGNCSCKRGRSRGRSRQSVPSAFIQEAVVMVRWKWFEWQVEVNIRRVRDLAPVISVQRRDPSVRILPKARTTQLYTRQRMNDCFLMAFALNDIESKCPEAQVVQDQKLGRGPLHSVYTCANRR